MIALFFKIFGLWIGYSMLRIFLRQNFVQKEKMTKIGILFFVFQTSQILFLKNFLLNWIILYGSLFVLFVVKFIYTKRLKTQFQSEFPGFLTSIILQMKLGQSFRQSLRFTHQTMKTQWQSVFREICYDVAFSQQEKQPTNSFWNDFCEEMRSEVKKIDGSTHKTIEKVENFRRRLIIIDKFRRRSGRIRGQVQIQVFFMCLIYALIFAVNAWLFDLWSYKLVLMISILFFILGLFMVVFIGRRIQWTV